MSEDDGEPFDLGDDADAPAPDYGSELVWGVSRNEWAAAYAGHVADVTSTRFVLAWEAGTLRAAFGRSGPYVEMFERGHPHYNVAINMPNETAWLLAQRLAAAFGHHLVKNEPVNVPAADIAPDDE